jgi:hypothetical protein
MKQKALPPALQDWVYARKKFHLSHAHVHMARELGMNPKKLGKLANHKQEPWKAPLPQFIERLYYKRFLRPQPENIMTIEQLFKSQEEKKKKRREAKKLRKEIEEAETLKMR